VLTRPDVPPASFRNHGEVPLACRTFGHRYRFSVDGSTMTWACGRCGADGGAKDYASAAEAERFARAFDREDREDLGRRAPLVAGLPLRLLRAWRRRGIS
jgi:hypothetical protein